MFFKFLLLVATLLVSCQCRMTCIDENGQPVDMFILYKLPEIIWYDTPPYVHDGHGYLYLDSNNQQFRLSKNPINSSSSSPGQTLNQIYQYNEADPSEMAYLMYNDENPDGSTYMDCGHTKGALAFDDESGFWLITSVPKYPNPKSSGYGYPDTGRKFGQMFMCVTFNSSTFNDIGLQIRFNDPHIYDSYLPEGWETKYPNINLALKGHMIRTTPKSNQASLVSVGGVKYTHFAKASSFGKDLYHDFVAPSLEAGLLTETWQYGKIIGPSCDGDYTVNDIVGLNISLKPQSFTFKCRNDHSKFVVTVTKEEPYICVGDINREPTQFRRGGGTLCTKNMILWNQYKSMVANATHC